MEAIERRVAWLSVSVVILVAFDASGGLALGFGRLAKWELVIYAGGLLCLAGAAVLLVAALAPPSVRRVDARERERFTFFAFVLTAIAVLAIAGLAIDAAIDAYRSGRG